MPSSTYLPISWLFLVATFLKIIIPAPSLYFFSSHSLPGTLVSTVTALVRITPHLHFAKFISPFLVLILFQLSATFDSVDTLSLSSPFFTWLLWTGFPLASLTALSQCPLPIASLISVKGRVIQDLDLIPFLYLYPYPNLCHPIPWS